MGGVCADQVGYHGRRGTTEGLQDGEGASEECLPGSVDVAAVVFHILGDDVAKMGDGLEPGDTVGLFFSVFYFVKRC